MITLPQAGPAGQSPDVAAIAAATVLLDADQGNDLMAQLDSKWFDQGRAYSIEGNPITVCWNDQQRAGYRFQEWLVGDDRAIAIGDWPILRRVEQRTLVLVAVTLGVH